MKKSYLITILAILALLASCKKDTTIGADILPSDDLLNAKYTDTFTMFSKTLNDTFMRTDKLAKNYLGVINDPIFGFQKASIVLELNRPNTVYDDTLGPFTADSVVLLLRYNSIYGDTIVAQDFTVSTINNKIDETSVYYSNNTAFPASSTIGTLSNYHFVPSNKVIVSNTDTVGANFMMRVPLNPSLGNTILNFGQNTLRDSLSFKNAFPAIRIENTTNSGKCMAEIDLNSPYSGIVIYYKNKYGVKKEMRLYTTISRAVNGTLISKPNSINLFDKTLSSTVNNVINSGLQSDSINYFLGQSGTTIKLSLPTINNQGKIAVNKAQIVVTQIIQNSDNDLTTPYIFLLLKQNTSGNLDIIPTAQSFLTSTGLQYSSAEGIGIVDSVGVDVFGNKYVRCNINLTKYIQNITNGTETNSDLYLAMYRSGGTDGATNTLNSYAIINNGTFAQFSYIPSRIIVAGANYSDARYKMKFNLMYSKIE